MRGGSGLRVVRKATALFGGDRALPTAIVASILLYAMVSCKEWMFSSPGWLDPWMYIGYGLHYTDETFLDWYYKVSRVPWILAQFLVRSFFEPVPANYILVTACLLGGVLGIFMAIRRLFGDLAAGVTAVCLGFHAFYHGSGGWDYHNSMAGPMYLWSYYFTVRASAETSLGEARALWLRSGIFLGLAVHSNFILVNFVLLLGVQFAFQYVTHRGYRLVPGLLTAGGYGALGVTAVTVALGLVNVIVGREFVFFKTLFRMASDWVADSSHGEVYWVPLTLERVAGSTWMVFPLAMLALSLVVIAVGLLGKDRKELLGARRREWFALGAAAQHVLLCALWFFWHLRGHVALSNEFYGYPLAITSMIALAGAIALLAGERTRFTAPAAALAALCFAVPLGIAFAVPALTARWAHAGAPIATPLVYYAAGFAGLLLVRRHRFGFVVPLVFLSMGNATAQGSCLEYRFGWRERPRKDHYRCIIGAHDALVARAHPSDIRIWFDESEEPAASPDRAGNAIPMRSFAYSLASVAFPYLAVPWPMPPIAGIPARAIRESAEQERLLVMVTDREENLRAMADRLDALGIAWTKPPAEWIRRGEHAFPLHVFKLYAESGWREKGAVEAAGFWLKQLILAQVPALASGELSDRERVALLREWCFTTVPAASDGVLPGREGDGDFSEIPVTQLLRGVFAGGEGFSSRGTAAALRGICRLFGYEAWVFRSGDGEAGPTHDVTLVSIPERDAAVISVQDAFFNLTFVDREGRLLDARAMIDLLEKGTEGGVAVKHGEHRWKRMTVAAAAAERVLAETGRDHEVRNIRASGGRTEFEYRPRGAEWPGQESLGNWVAGKAAGRGFAGLLLFPVSTSGEPGAEELMEKALAARERLLRGSPR